MEKHIYLKRPLIAVSRSPKKGFLGPSLVFLLVMICGILVTGRLLSASGEKTPIKLVPELTIGQESGDLNLIFGTVTRVDVDAAGNIYVLDHKYCRLKVFSSEGKFIRSHNIPPGQGPQETTQIAGIAVTPSGWSSSTATAK